MLAHEVSLIFFFRNVDANDIVHMSFPPCFIIRALSSSIRSDEATLLLHGLSQPSEKRSDPHHRQA